MLRISASIAPLYLTPRRSLSAGLSLVLLFSLLGTPPQALADGFIYIPRPPHVIPPPPRPPFPLRRPRPSFPMQVTRHRVTVEMDDTLARTRVDETFHNPNNVQLEGVYMFPLPAGAAVSDFRMKMGGKEVSGEILEKDKARQIYEQIVRQVRDPGLLEYVDRGLFRASVFPIPPRGGVEVTIEYGETLNRERGLTRYRYPLDTGKYSAGDYRDVVFDVKVRSSLPLRAIHCPSHDVAVSRKGEREARASFEAKTLRADKDFVLLWNVSEEALAPVLVTHRGHEDRGFFYLAFAPRADRADKVPPKDLIFVIDTSGSMMGTKLEQVKKALRHCLHGLNAGDRFNIVDFSTEARRFREELVTVSEETRRQAEAYVGELKARGGTNLEEGLRFGLESARQEGRLQIVVLLTDGEPTIGITRSDELLKSVQARNKSKRRVFVFGVGEDLNAKLLDLLVKENRGTSQYIRGDENLEVPLSTFYDKIDSPVLTDLKIEFPAGGVTDLYPRPLPDLFRGEQLDIFGRYDTDGRKTVVVKGKLAGESRVFEYSLDFKGGDNAHVPRLWATRTIGYLLEQMRLSGETKEVKDEVIRLSKLYGVITPYTSYLILEEDRVAARPRRGGEPRLFFHYAPRDAILRGRPQSAPAAREVFEEAARAAEDLDLSAGAGAVRASKKLGEFKDGRAAGTVSTYLGRVANADGIRIQNVGDRTFYFQENRWIDGALTTTELEKTGALKRVKYLSDEYFALLTTHPGIGRYLSLGPQVTFLWKGQLISVE